MPPKGKGHSGTAGRFGARYGRLARRRVADIEATARASHDCPDCGEERVTRTDTGIWECGACGHRFAGGAYNPDTPAGRTVPRAIRAALDEDE